MASHNEPNLDSDYSRRLDRTPEHATSNLARLSTDDRKKIYGLRTAFGNTLSKLQQLEESNDEKDLMIEREKQLRKNLEEKLMNTKLVDMYGDPGVNEELHDRLPRAAKSRMFSMQETPRNSKNARRKKNVRSEDERSLSDDEYQYSSKYHRSYPGSTAYPPFFGGPGSYGWSAPGMMYSPSFAQHSTPNNPTSQSSPQQMPSFSFNQMPPSASSNVNGITATGQAPSSHGATAGDADVMKAVSLLSSDSKERQLARLLHEIDLLKDQNRKISAELAESISRCNRLKVENELMSDSSEEQVSSRISVLVQEIYSKQKQRDKAMMGRLKLANEERDRANTMVMSLSQGQNMQDALSDDGEQDPSHRSVACMLDVKQQTSNLLETLHSSTLRSNAQHSQTVKAITVERDSAERKVQQLQMEILRLQREVDEMTRIQEQHLRLQSQLSMTQEERDIALTKLQTLEEENNNLKIYYGLHKSLSKEQCWKEQYNNSLNQMQELIAQREGNVIDAQKQTNKLQEIIQELTEERDLLSQQMQKLEATETEHQRTNEKLQRHVSVLQKKLKKLSHGDQGRV